MRLPLGGVSLQGTDERSSNDAKCKGKADLLAVHGRNTVLRPQRDRQLQHCEHDKRHHDRLSPEGIKKKRVCCSGE